MVLTALDILTDFMPEAYKPSLKQEYDKYLSKDLVINQDCTKYFLLPKLEVVFVIEKNYSINSNLLVYLHDGLEDTIRLTTTALEDISNEAIEPLLDMYVDEMKKDYSDKLGLGKKEAQLQATPIKVFTNDNFLEIPHYNLRNCLLGDWNVDEVKKVQLQFSNGKFSLLQLNKGLYDLRQQVLSNKNLFTSLSKEDLIRLKNPQSDANTIGSLGRALLILNNYLLNKDKYLDLKYEPTSEENEILTWGEQLGTKVEEPTTNKMYVPDLNREYEELKKLLEAKNV